MTGYAESDVLRTQDGELKYPVLSKPFTKAQLARAVARELAGNAEELETVRKVLASRK